jgi:hypothetical protein
MKVFPSPLLVPLGVLTLADVKTDISGQIYNCLRQRTCNIVYTTVTKLRNAQNENTTKYLNMSLHAHK